MRRVHKAVAVRDFRAERADREFKTSAQAAQAKASAIAELRDAHLPLQVLDLCHGTLYMWRAMRQHHEAQRLITEIHHKATRELESAMNAWRAALSDVASRQRGYVRDVLGWLRRTLPPQQHHFANDLAVALTRASPVARELAAFVDRWDKVLHRARDIEARVLNSIQNFAGAVHELHKLQKVELEVARRLKDKIAARREIPEHEMRRHAEALDATRSATVRTMREKRPAVYEAMTAYLASLADD